LSVFTAESSANALPVPVKNKKPKIQASEFFTSQLSFGLIKTTFNLGLNKARNLPHKTLGNCVTFSSFDRAG